MTDGQEVLLEGSEHLLPPSCFVICPIGDEHAEIGTADRDRWENSIELFEQVIEPACSALGLRPLRADQIARTGEIPEQIFTRLRDDEVVIADLTDGNPNVMYELGLRHTTGKLTVQLGERGRLPFDVAAIRTIVFVRTPGGLIHARKRLTETLAAGLTSGSDQVTATRVWQHASTWSSLAEGAGVDGEEAGFLEKLADLEENIGRLPDLMTEVKDIMVVMSTSTEETTEKVQKANQSGAPASTRLYLANELAASLEPHATKLDEVASAYELAVQRVDPGVRHILSAPKNGPEAEQLESFRDTIRVALDAAEKYASSAVGLRDQLKQSGDATRSMRRVNGRIRAALTRLIAATEHLLQWRSLLD